MKITFRLSEKKDADLIKIFEGLSPGTRSERIKSLLRRGAGTNTVPVATPRSAPVATRRTLKIEPPAQDEDNILKNLLCNF
jgi:hypothetical protein